MYVDWHFHGALIFFQWPVLTLLVVDSSDLNQSSCQYVATDSGQFLSPVSPNNSLGFFINSGAFFSIIIRFSSSMITCFRNGSIRCKYDHVNFFFLSTPMAPKRRASFVTSFL